MYNRVAVGADRSEIFLRIHKIAGANVGQWDYVVNVNKARCDGAVTFLKKDVADYAPQSEVCDTCSPCLWITFVCIYQDGFLRTLSKTLTRWYFLRQQRIVSAGPPTP
jgi:hypothetical protein